MATTAQIAAAHYLRSLSRELLGVEAPPEAIEALCAQAPPVAFTAGDVVFRQNDPGDRALFVVEGRLRATLRSEGAERALGDVTPGDVVGETAIFVRAGHRTATVSAVEPTTCLELTRELFQRAALNPALVALEVHLADLLARRIAGTDALLVKAWREAGGKPDVRDRLLGLLGGRQ
jgi:CRP-like cAMP-binding protein